MSAEGNQTKGMIDEEVRNLNHVTECIPQKETTDKKIVVISKPSSAGNIIVGIGIFVIVTTGLFLKMTGSFFLGYFFIAFFALVFCFFLKNLIEGSKATDTSEDENIYKPKDFRTYATDDFEFITKFHIED